MTVNTRISFREYVALLYTITYRRPIMILLLVVDLLVIGWILGYYSGLPLPKPVYYQYLTVLLITVVQPLVIYTTIRRNYYSSSHLKQPVSIEFTQDEIRITGESFYTMLMWPKMFKVVELKRWFLIYENNLAAVIIQKRAFTPTQAQAFRTLAKDIPGVPFYQKS